MEVGIGQVFVVLLNKYGIAGAIFIFTMILSLFYGSVVGCKYLFNYLMERCKNKKIKLKNHHFFIELDYLMNHKLKDVKTTCVIRKKLYVDIMKIRIDNLKKIFSNFVKEDISGLAAKDLYYKVLSALDDANTAAITGAVSEGVPIFVLDSMNEKRKMINKLYYNAIKGYCYNNYIYSNNNQRMYAILQLIGIYVECYMNVLQENLAQFNGNVKSLNYKGVSCMDCSYCIHEKYLSELKQEINEDLKIQRS